MTALKNLTALESFVRKTVDETTITDIHTHLFPPSHGNLLLWGVDEVLTYHYLIAELFTIAPNTLRPKEFWRLSKSRQADMVWEHVFLKHGALSEAARGAITVFNKLGLDIAGRDLAGIRKWFAQQNVSEYLDKVFELAGLDYAVMTNDPFKAEEVQYWQSEAPVPEKLKTALRIDTLAINWPTASQIMCAAGYDTNEPNEKSFAEAQRFLHDWIDRINPMYMAASLASDFQYPTNHLTTQIIDKVILPVAKERAIPMAMMIGVRRGMNPSLGDGGDGVGVSDVSAVANLCAKNPDVKFLVTMLSRVNQHELCITARKFGNLHLFGCWWFCNDPSIIDEMTRQRLELLGATFTSQHSDARVLDQLIYKWAHSRKVIGDVLVDKYRDLHLAGWRSTEDEIRRDVRNLFGGMFEEFLAK